MDAIEYILIAALALSFCIFFRKRILCSLFHEKHFKQIETHTGFLGRSVTTYRCSKCGIEHTYKGSIRKPWGG